MVAFFRNVATLLHKELLMILKDKRGRFILVMPLIVQTIIFGFVASFDLNKVEYALLDEDHSYSSRQLVALFDGSPIFERVKTLQNSSQFAQTLDNKEALLILHIAHDFERQLTLGQSAPVQILVDGRNSNTAGTALGYANSIVNSFNSRELGLNTQSSAQTRSWYNPNLESRWGILSSLLAVLSLIQVVILAGQSVAREKEQGTFDQLLVTPFSPMVIMLGKALPPVLVGLFQSSLILIITTQFFGIPFQGSLITLYTTLTLFTFSVVGIGLCLSACSKTMQQAMLYTFTALMPMILLSGFATPISSMPQSLQIATLINPVRYGIECARRVYLEGATLQEISHCLWPMLVLACCSLATSAKLFRAKL